MVMVAVSPVHAEGWKRASATAGWSSADRFTSELTRRNPVVGSGSFEAFLGTLHGGELTQLMDLISRAESPHLGYDSVQKRARVKPPRKPSQMTLGGIFTWIGNTPGQQHAIGRYQVIPSTLAYVSKELGFRHSTPYDRRTQDLIATFLIREAGYEAFRSGRLSRQGFMDNLARIWAGLPLADGRSAYHGKAGNRATISREQFVRAMASIFPVRRASR